MRQPHQVAEEGKVAGAVQRRQSFQEQPPEQPRQHSDQEEEARAAGDPPRAVGPQPAAAHDHVDMRMVDQRRARRVEGAPPARCVQHAGHADPGAEVPRIGSDRGQRLGGGAEQQVVDRLLVPEGDAGDLRRQGEDDVEVLDRQQILGSCSHPVPRGRSLALRAVPVLARVVCDVPVAALRARRHVTAERLRPAGFDRRHDLELGQADMTGMGPPPRGAMGAEDVGDLQLRPDHPGPGATRGRA